MGKIGNIDFGYLKNSKYIIGQFQQQKFETLMKKSLFLHHISGTGFMQFQLG